MNMKQIVALAIAAALVAGFLLAGKDNSQTADDLQIEAEPTPTGSTSAGSTMPSRDPVEVHVSKNAEDAVEPPKWPDEIENMIFDYLSQLEGFEFVAITSVQCEAHTCEIVFSGPNPNPTIVDDYSGIMSGLHRPPINAGQGSIGTREIAAGAREFVISISNVPYVEPTVDQ
jgi:hypothetical protein